MASFSRLEAARNRAGTLKRVVAAAAAIGFVGAGVLARATHPGQATSRSRPTSASTQVQSSDESGAESESGGFGIAPSRSQPQVQTGAS